MKRNFFLRGIIFVSVICLIGTGTINAQSTSAEHLAKIRDACTSLKVTANDSQADITKKYRSAAKRSHPDRYVGSKEEGEKLFKEIGAAFELLKNEENFRLISRAINAQSKKSEPTCSPNTFDTTSELFDSDVDDDLFGSFEDIFNGAKATPEDLSSVTCFTPEFVRTTISWINNEKMNEPIYGYHPDTGKYGLCTPTPKMRLCSAWLSLMACAKSNNSEQLELILKSNPKLINLHDGIADALSLFHAANRDRPLALRPGVERVHAILLSYGAVARFPHYNGGICGFSKGYLY